MKKPEIKIRSLHYDDLVTWMAHHDRRPMPDGSFEIEGDKGRLVLYWQELIESSGWVSICGWTYDVRWGTRNEWGDWTHEESGPLDSLEKLEELMTRIGARR